MTAYDPQRTAVVLLDLQPAIVSMLQDEKKARQILDCSAQLVQAARSKGMTIVFVRVALTEKEFAAMPTTNKTSSRFREIGVKCISDAGLEAEQASSQIHPDLGAIQPTDVQIRKTRSCAFTTTDLHAQLQARNIDTLIVAGIATSNAVLASLRHAENLDYGLTVVESGCADRSADVHDFLMQHCFPSIADVQSIEQTIERMGIKGGTL